VAAGEGHGHGSQPGLTGAASMERSRIYSHGGGRVRVMWKSIVRRTSSPGRNSSGPLRMSSPCKSPRTPPLYVRAEDIPADELEREARRPRRGARRWQEWGLSSTRSSKALWTSTDRTRLVLLRQTYIRDRDHDRRELIMQIRGSHKGHGRTVLVRRFNGGNLAKALASSPEPWEPTSRLAAFLTRLTALSSRKAGWRV